MRHILSKLLISVSLITYGYAQAGVIIYTPSRNYAEEERIANEQQRLKDKTISKYDSYLIFIKKLEQIRKVYSKIHDPKLSITWEKVINSGLLAIDPVNPPIILRDKIIKDGMEITIKRDVSFLLDNVNESQCNIILNNFKTDEKLLSFKINEIETKINRNNKTINKNYKCNDINTLYWK